MIDSSATQISTLQAALPLPVRRPRRGVGSFITFDLGKAPEDTEIHVWIYLCDWVIARGEVQILSSTDLGVEGAPLECLSSVTLQSIELHPSSGSITFAFDNDTRLMLTPNLNAYTPGDDLVMFFRPRRRVLALSPNRGLYETS